MEHIINLSKYEVKNIGDHSSDFGTFCAVNDDCVQWHIGYGKESGFSQTER